MLDDAELLRRYASDRSENAFAELVRRHLAFVYAAALRQVGGDDSLAQDVAQIVFSDLGRKASELTRHRVLLGWLFTSTRYAAGKIVRGEQRRRAREWEAHTMHELNYEPAACADWAELRPVIDEVLASLNQTDRETVLLRFFEGCAFPEIGARFAITGDAARLRVERALDKMRAGLARHGVKSTTAGLALALANQPALALPTGLSAAVTGAALATATAGGGVIAGGLSIFMNTTKLGWTVGAALLAVSLAGNAYFLTREADVASAPGAPNTKPMPLATRSAGAAAAPAPPLANVDVAALRDQLRASGADEELVRTIVHGILRRRGRQEVSKQIFERAERGWWRDQHLTRGMTDLGTAEDPAIYQSIVTAPLEGLLGADPLDIAVSDARYAFLPGALGEEFGKLDRAQLSVLTAARTGNPTNDPAKAAEVQQQLRALEEKRQALRQTFTPEQRANWDMRLSPVASSLGRRTDLANGTEAEYVALFPIADGYAKASAEKLPDGTDVAAARNELQRSTMKQLVTTFGYERALDYIWSGTQEYTVVARASRDLNLPNSTAARVTQLAAETGVEAAKIEANPAATSEEKRAALAALQQRTQPALDALLSPDAQQQLGAAATTWFTALGRGSFKPIAPTLPGVSEFTAFNATISIGGPPVANRPSVVLPEPPSNR